MTALSFAFLGLDDAQQTAALVALATALVTTLAASPLRYVVDRALLVQKSKTEYEYEARKDLRLPGVSSSGRGGFRTCDLSRVKQRCATALRSFMPGNRPNRTPHTMIGSSAIRSGTAAFGPTIGPTVEISELHAASGLLGECSHSAIGSLAMDPPA
ncbi:MAG: hypothetical protein ACXVUE_20300 [Solirubrobacteraceae bacterium]